MTQPYIIESTDTHAPPTLPVVDPATPTDGPIMLQKRAAANVTLSNANTAYKTVMVTRIVDSNNEESRDYFARASERENQHSKQVIGVIVSDHSFSMCPRPTTGEDDFRNNITSRWDVPSTIALDSIENGNLIKVQLYNPDTHMPSYHCLGGSPDAEGVVISVEGGTTVNQVPRGSGRAGSRGLNAGQPKPCLEENLRSGGQLVRPPIKNKQGVTVLGGRLSPIPPACASAWGRKHFDLPTLAHFSGEYPLHPVTKVTADSKFNKSGRLDIAFSYQTDYGPRPHPSGKGASYHPGVDFNKTNTGLSFNGAPIFTSLDGKVREIGVSETWGKFIIMDHGPYYDLVDRRNIKISGYTLMTVYAHLKTFTVKRGMMVARGEQIALSNNTGNSFGDHLHYEVIVARAGNWDGYNDTSRTDPLIFLNSKFTKNGKFTKT